MFQVTLEALSLHAEQKNVFCLSWPITMLSIRQR